VGAALLVLVLSVGCGSREERTLHQVSRAIQEGSAANAASLLSQVTRHPNDFVPVLEGVLGLSADNWPGHLPALLEQAAKSDAALRAIEKRAQTEEIDDRSRRAIYAMTVERDLTSSLIMGVLAKDATGRLAGNVEDVVHAALLAWKAADGATRERADEVMSALGEGALAPLVSALKQPDPLTRAGAVRWLGRTGRSEIVPFLRDLVGAEDDSAVLYELPIALGRCDGAEAVGALAAMLALRDDLTYVTGSGQARAEAVEQIRQKVVAAPGLIPTVLGTLVQRLADENSYVVSRASAALVSIALAYRRGHATTERTPRPPDRDPVDVYLEVVREGWRTTPLSVVSQVDADQEKARRMAFLTAMAGVLVSLREPPAMSEAQRGSFLDLLDRALEDEDVRAGAASILARMEGYAVPVLVARLGSDSAPVRVVVARTLGEIGDLRAVEPLAARLGQEQDAEVLVAILGAIQAMRARDAIPAMAAVLDGPSATDPRVRGALSDAFGRVADSARYPDAMRRAVESIRGWALSAAVRESVRDSALAALGKIKPAGVNLDLRNVLLDEREPDALRKTAAWALGELGAKEAVPAMEEILRIAREEPTDFLGRMKRLYGNETNLNARWQRLGWQAGYRNFREVKPIPSLVRSEVVHAYRKIQGAAAAPLLAQVLEDDQRAAVRQAAAFSLGELKKEPQALARALQKDDVGAVRAAAAEALGKIKTEEVVPHLLMALRKDKYETTRVNAAIGLREAKFDSAVRGLVSVLKREHLKRHETETPGVLSETGIALQKDGAMAGPSVATALAHGEAAVRAAAASILGVIDAEESLDALLASVEDTSPTVRENAIYALGRLQRRKATPVLIQRLRDAAEWNRVRAAAAWALGSIRDRAAAEALSEALDDPNGGVRSAAATALGRLRAVAARGALVRIASDYTEPDDVRVAAVGALGEIGGEEADNVLRALLAQDIGDVRVAVVNALGAMESQAAAASLVAVLEDRGAGLTLRQAAATALGAIGDARAAPAIVARLMDPTERRIGFVGADEHNPFWQALNLAAANFRLPADALAMLEARLHDPWESIHVRRRVPYSMGSVDTPLGAPALVKALDIGDNELSAAAIRAMGRTGDRSLAQRLTDLVRAGPSVEQRREAATALGYLGDPAGIAPLREVLAAGVDQSIRRNAAAALGRLRAGDALAAQLADASTPASVRVAVLNALGDMGAAARSALTAVDAQRDDEHGGVAFAAWAARTAIAGSPSGV
jgi:HEAT repeat protein